MTTPDPTPDLLPPARPSGFIRAPALDKIRAWHAAALDQTSYPMIVCGALLAHLDALQAPAPDDGGEALGLAIFAASDMQAGETPESTAAEWARLLPDARAEMIRQGLALDAHGYARGVAAGSETLRHLIDQRNLAQRTAEDAHREIARLTAEIDAERALTTELRAMEAEALASADRWRAASERHEREAAEARADLDAAQREYIEATERADIAEATAGNLRAELAEARALHEAVVEQKIAAHAEEVRLLAKRDAEAIAAARLDVAREERRLCLEDIATIQRAPHPEYSGAIRVLGQAIDAIRARTEGRQG